MALSRVGKQMFCEEMLEHIVDTLTSRSVRNTIVWMHFIVHALLDLPQQFVTFHSGSTDSAVEFTQPIFLRLFLVLSPPLFVRLLLCNWGWP